MSAPTGTGHGDTRAPATVCIHAGLPEARQGEPLLPGPTFAAPYHLMGDVSSSPYAYNRQGNPTWTAYESALGELERGHVTVFASGLAAVVAVLGPTLSPGDRLLVPSDSYSLVRDLATRHLAPRGVVIEMAPTGTAAFREAIPRADLVWLESLSNPRLDACDVADLVAVAHTHGAQVAVDNSFVTPLGQRPLDLGADFAVASASKYLTGHSDLMLGYVAVTSEESAQAVRRWRSLTGAVAGPFEAWLAHRSLATLALRFERQCANALALAGHLAVQPGVQDVALSRPARGYRPRSGVPASADVRERDHLFARERRAGRGVSRELRAGHRGHELRGRPHDRRTHAPLGTRRRARGVHPHERRVRGERGHHRGRHERARTPMTRQGGAVSGRWTLSDAPDQSGRIAVVTGASGGIGLATAKALARLKATVVLACRDPKRAVRAADEIHAVEGGADVRVVRLDLASLASVRDAAAELRSTCSHIDLLINNAGVMQVPSHRRSEDGFELTFATNHLGHFALTGLVLDRLLAAPRSRIVTVSSLAHRRGVIDVDDLELERGYTPGGAYDRSKLANLLFTYELDRRLRAMGAGTIALAAHPGIVSTDLWRTSSRAERLLTGPPPAGAQLLARSEPGARRAADPSGRPRPVRPSR